MFLDSAELCLRRIAERVAQGGHDVPEEDVRRRFERVFPVFWQHYQPLADRCLIAFNGGVFNSHPCPRRHHRCRTKESFNVFLLFIQ